MLKYFKYVLTLIGSRLSKSTLMQIQASVNYLRTGRWFRDHSFTIGRRVGSAQHVWTVVINRVRNKKVLYLEFGVASGRSIKYWSRKLKHPDTMLHGFDSFEGLPEDGGPWRKGQFDTMGRIPETDDPRVRFFKGWFDQVLPSYSIPAHEVLVINMDADLYSSTIYVLRHLRPHIKRGTYIYFDEMNHVEHEPRAFDEFIRESGLQFKLVAVDMTMAFCCFECLG
jgi:O-methyltransferase